MSVLFFAHVGSQEDVPAAQQNATRKKHMPSENLHHDGKPSESYQKQKLKAPGGQTSKCSLNDLGEYKRDG